MTRRLVDVIVSGAHSRQARAILRRSGAQPWTQTLDRGTVKVSAVVPTDELDDVLAEVRDACAADRRLHIIVMALESSQATGSASENDDDERGRLRRFLTRDRLSTDELRDDLHDATRVDVVYLVTIVISAMIAALGMRKGETAIVIGAMIIAPLLAPTMAAAMAATVGDATLARRAVATLSLGTALALGFSVLLGMVFTVDATVPELLSRTNIGVEEVLLALASGIAGTLAFGRGLSSSLVGVMVAVALMPPIAAAGLLLGSGHTRLGLMALLLFAVNLVALNVAGIATFLALGLPPRTWRVTSALLMMWIGMLIALVALVTAHSFTA